jgi:hypothetical protein
MSESCQQTMLCQCFVLAWEGDILCHVFVYLPIFSCHVFLVFLFFPRPWFVVVVAHTPSSRIPRSP